MDKGENSTRKRKKAKRKAEKNQTVVFTGILLLVIILAGGFLTFKLFGHAKGNNTQETGKVEENKVEEVEIKEKTVEIYSGTDRPIAVMIDNHSGAWPQAGLQQAYMIYEIIVEGTETRLMALFKGIDTEKIGPVRSARHYFLDYVLEHDAIYAHFGQSPQAKKDLTKLGIDNINGTAEDGTTFWRINSKNAPHNAMTSTKKILESAKNKKYPIKESKGSVLDYTVDEISLENGIEIQSVLIPHTNTQKVKYIYNNENKVFERHARNIAQKDLETGDTLTVKNIIISFVDNYSIAGDDKGRQGIKNIGTFDGYYITNGRAIKIKCIKNSRGEQTKYQDLDGNEIKVNDGNTFINICPPDAKVVFEEVQTTENTNI